MGSTGEADRKRRHLTSISPPSVPAKKPSSLPVSEDKKLDTTVLQFQNQKLSQKLEVQKIEISSLANKLSDRKSKQQLHEKRLATVKESWDRLVNGLESTSLEIRRVTSRSEQDVQSSSAPPDVTSSSADVAFLSRLTETGATECCSANDSPSMMIGDEKETCEKAKYILGNLVVAIDGLWGLKEKLCSTMLMPITSNDSCRQRTSNDLVSEVQSLRSTLGDLHLKHKSLARELRHHQDNDLKNKAELIRLRAELEATLKDLEESNHQLAILKAEKDATEGLFFPVLNIASKHNIAGDKITDKQKNLQDLEHALKELMDQSSSRLEELKSLHEERIVILRKLSQVQSTLRDLKYASSSQSFGMVSEQIEKSKAELMHYQALYEKLQSERDNLAWHEREANSKCDLADIYRRSGAVADARTHDLGVEIKKRLDERKQIESRLEESSKEPGRKDIITSFKSLIASFPKEMSIMQSQLSEYKEMAANIDSLRANVHCAKAVLDRKTKEWEALSARSSSQETEVQRLQAVVHDLEQTEKELKLFLDMYKQESVLTSEVSDARDSEFKGWAHVQGLKSSLDERNLEFRVKEAIEAEAISQQRLAAAEAEIADLREQWNATRRELSNLSEALKSKKEENEAYLSEIETIGQAYDDMQNQNQHLLQQITERDDYNIKLVLESVKARQMHDALLMEKQSLEKRIKQANLTADFFGGKAARIEDQVKACSDLVHRHKEDRRRNSATLEAIQRKLSDAKRSSQQGRESLEVLHLKIRNHRERLAETQIERERERFARKRLQEDLEALRRKASQLKAQLEGSSTVGKLRHELQEYKEILKCSICHDRAKEVELQKVGISQGLSSASLEPGVSSATTSLSFETRVVITKCYHLFCSPCVQRLTETRHRRCPVCSTSFGPNDVKPVYI